MRAIFQSSAAIFLVHLIAIGGDSLLAAAPPADPELDMLRRIDLDKNGFVTPAEIPSAMKSFVAGIVRRSGLTEGKPISLDALARSRSELKLTPDDSELKGGVIESSKGPAGADDKSRKPSPALFAENLLKLYDKNNSGILEAKEWSRLHESWKERDTNGDGLLTLDELTAAFTAIAAAENEKVAEERRPSPAAIAAPTDAQSPINTVPRIPSKSPRSGRSQLPDWLSALDANGDGQVQMAEYSKEWPDAKIAEFMKYDRNNDGYITPAEAVAAARAK